MVVSDPMVLMFMGWVSAKEKALLVWISILNLYTGKIAKI
jgi:hypothetical protein